MDYNNNWANQAFGNIANTGYSSPTFGNNYNTRSQTRMRMADNGMTGYPQSSQSTLPPKYQQDYVYRGGKKSRKSKKMKKSRKSRRR